MARWRSLIERYLQHYEAGEVFGKIQVALTVLMHIAFIGAFVIGFFERLWMVMFVSVIAMLLIWLPLAFAKTNRVHIPIEFEFLLTLFLYGTLFLGEIRGFYTKFWWWDLVLHAGSGIALGFIGFLILFVLYKNGKLNVRPALFAVFSFAFALALGALWEIFEFIMDISFGFSMQKTGIMDTMWDLIVDAGGALVASLSGYFYIKYKRKGSGVFEHYLTSYLEKNYK